MTGKNSYDEKKEERIKRWIGKEINCFVSYQRDKIQLLYDR